MVVAKNPISKRSRKIKWKKNMSYFFEPFELTRHNKKKKMSTQNKRILN